MPESPAIAIIVLLALPGLLAVGLYQTLTPTKPHELSVQVVLAIVLSILSYIAVALLHSLMGWIPDPRLLLQASSGDLASVFATDVLVVVASACGISAVTAVILVVQTCNEWLHKACRLARITRKYGHSSHWDTVVMTKARKCWINVKFHDGDQYVGAIDSHSSSSDERSLLLSNVAKVLDGKPKEEWGEGDLLFIPDISCVRSMRISATSKESNRGRKQRDKAGSAKGERITEVQQVAGGTGDLSLRTKGVDGKQE